MKKTRLLLTLAIIISSFSSLQAEEISVVDIKRNITLSDEDLVYKDFYINAGTAAGLKKHQVVNVKRRITVRGAGQKSMGEFESLVGQIRIIQVSDKISVGREYKLFSREQESMLEQTGIMAGDHIDLAGSFVDDKYSKKTATLDLTLPDSPVVNNSKAPALIPEPPIKVPTPDDKNVVSSVISPADNSKQNDRAPASVKK